MLFRSGYPRSIMSAKPVTATAGENVAKRFRWKKFSEDSKSRNRFRSVVNKGLVVLRTLRMDGGSLKSIDLRSTLLQPNEKRIVDTRSAEPSLKDGRSSTDAHDDRCSWGC
jgi:archaeosine-15-forming tRNA-guanine transglycosylase